VTGTGAAGEHVAYYVICKVDCSNSFARWRYLCFFLRQFTLASYWGCTGYLVEFCSSGISGHFSLSGSVFGSWQPRNRIIIINYYFIDSSCCTLDPNQDITSYMKLVTSSTPKSGCPSQTSTVPKLLSAHSDGVVASTQLSVCLTVLTSISGSGQMADLSIRLQSDSENPCPAHPYQLLPVGLCD